MTDDTLDVVIASPVLRAVQAPLFAQIQQLVDVARQVRTLRTLDDATEHALEVIGRIVGAYPRPTVDAGSIVYFTPDEGEGAADVADAFVTNAPTAGAVPADDIRYRAAIRSKILKNHTRHGSAPELMWYGKFAYGIPVSVRNEGLGDVSFTVPTGTSAEKLAALLRDVTNNQADHQFEMPLPTTARVVAVNFRYPLAFAPDVESGAADIAFVGVGYGLNP